MCFQIKFWPWVKSRCRKKKGFLVKYEVDLISILWADSAPLRHLLLCGHSYNMGTFYIGADDRDDDSSCGLLSYSISSNVTKSRAKILPLSSSVQCVKYALFSLRVFSPLELSAAMWFALATRTHIKSGIALRSKASPNILSLWVCYCGQQLLVVSYICLGLQMTQWKDYWQWPCSVNWKVPSVDYQLWDLESFDFVAEPQVT